MRARFLFGPAVVLLIGAAALLDGLFPPGVRRWTERSTVVSSAKGEILQIFPVEDGRWRLTTEPEEVDPLYLSMLIAMEDQRFGRHPGVDPLAAARAAGQALRHRRIVSGASTLAMQVARLLEPKARTLESKLLESARALQLQRRYGSQGILRMYLTLAPFGGPVEGVTAASLVWFGKLPLRLSPAEAALLAALPQSPERLRPDRFPEAAAKARNRVLQRAAERGILSPDAAAAAQTEPVPAFQRPMPFLAPHLGQRLATSAPPGSLIRTTLDHALQRQLEDVARSWTTRLEPGDDLAAVILANRDRRLLAHLGSADWHRRQLDLSQAVRSPGSALKPFIYAVAFDDLSLHPGTLIFDSPQRFGSWAPRNFDEGFQGQVSAREALQQSLNIPAVLTLEKVGPARLTSLLKLSGADLVFPRGADPGLPLALGGAGIRLSDLALLYAGLADGGRMLPVRSVMEPPGEEIAPTAPWQFVGETAARVTLDILEGTPAPDGVASRRLSTTPRSIAFKTGTSFGFRDALAVGVSPDYTVAVWVGRPDGGPRSGGMGRTSAAPLMFRVFDLLPPDRNPRPPPREPDHALFCNRPPAGLQVLSAEPLSKSHGRSHAAPLRILFPPDGAAVESLEEGIALKAAGGRAPLHWIVNGEPLPEGSRFWKADGNGFSQVVAVDADGQQAAAAIRVSGMEERR